MYLLENKNKMKIRQATFEDIPQIVELEELVWEKENAAQCEMIKSRIKTFPEGTLVASININREKIIGFASTQIVNYDIEKMFVLGMK